MSQTKSIGSPFFYAHAATDNSSDEPPAKHPLPAAGRHRLDRHNDKQWRVVVPPRRKEKQ